MSREAFGDPPDPEPEFCPVCGGQEHDDGCEFGKEQARRVRAESAATRLWAQQQNLAMMLRKCAHALMRRNREDLAADAVGLLRRQHQWELQCLRITRSGYPQHPLYLPGDCRLHNFSSNAIDEAMQP